ncbi:Protein of unknown function [Pyronema omphalodes CBS 100304]|uniref:Uncharacterized protein n=1 Tax=Pyronema omphalodes (strain CBS 100304) TaxID=1076935 RepID=U4LL53_PYROM|nr:Protein of unknown function [Pyronema omphalodes CBS 100304]
MSTYLRVRGWKRKYSLWGAKDLKFAQYSQFDLPHFQQSRAPSDPNSPRFRTLIVKSETCIIDLKGYAGYTSHLQH